MEPVIELELYLIRHGESQANEKGLFLGHGDLDLTERGRAQAQKTAEYLKNEQSFHEYYDEIEICAESAEKHFKSAHQTRNRSMVDRSDLVVFCFWVL